MDIERDSSNKINVTLMMATYNGERYLEEQLESIYKQQTTANVKLYIRDDGSKDDTTRIIEKWSSYLDIVFIEGKNLGPAKGFWELIHLVPLDADFYAFADQDDVWDSDKIESAITGLKFTDSPALYFSNSRYVDENLNPLNSNLHFISPMLTIPSQVVCGSAQGCTMMFNKSAAKILKAAKVQCIPMHDLVVMLHILATGKVIYDPVPRMSYRQHSNNVVAKNNKSFIKKLKGTYTLWIKNSKETPVSSTISELIKNYGDIMDSDLKEYLHLLIKYKKSIFYKVKILLDKRTATTSSKALRSFRIRLVLGLL